MQNIADSRQIRETQPLLSCTPLTHSSFPPSVSILKTNVHIHFPTPPCSLFPIDTCVLLSGSQSCEVRGQTAVGVLRTSEMRLDLPRWQSRVSFEGFQCWCNLEASRNSHTSSLRLKSHPTCRVARLACRPP